MAKNVEFYLSKGMPLDIAKYFSDGRKKLLKASANKDFTLTLTFEKNEQRLYDVKPLLTKGTIFEPFLDYKNFERVYVDDSNAICWDIDPTVDSNIVWNNKVDLDPDTAYVNSIPL